MKNSYRIDITVRLVPQDTTLPVKEMTASLDARNDDARIFPRLAAGNKASQMVERMQRQVFGEEPL